MELDKLGSLAKNTEIFQNICAKVRSKYAPAEQKYVRANQAKSTNTELNHATMVRSRYGTIM